MSAGDPTLPTLVESLTQNQTQLRSEVDRLRERSHRYGEKLQEHEAELAAVDRRLDDEVAALNRRVDSMGASINEKLDAIHRSIKGDLTEIKRGNAATNKKVDGHGETIAKLKGAFAILAVGAPSVIALAVVAIEHLH